MRRQTRVAASRLVRPPCKSLERVKRLAPGGAYLIGAGDSRVRSPAKTSRQYRHPCTFCTHQDIDDLVKSGEDTKSMHSAGPYRSYHIAVWCLGQHPDSVTWYLEQNKYRFWSAEPSVFLETAVRMLRVILERSNRKTYSDRQVTGPKQPSAGIHSTAVTGVKHSPQAHR